MTPWKRAVNFVWPRRAKKEPVRKVSSKKLEEEFTFQSYILAAAFQTLACDIHEHCDGSCSNTIAYEHPPLLGQGGLLVPMFMPIVNPHPSSATAEDVPHDTRWVETQEFPALDYSAINSQGGEIRLLKIKNGVFRSDVVECDIITTTLGQCPKFQALSYCCGLGDKTEVVLCDGKKLYIQGTLNAALKTFRESSKFDDQLLWTDGISINQANKMEVGEQIPLMRRIYTEATGVFVHLGLAERQMSQGLDLMCRLNVVQQHLKSPEEYGSISLDDVKLPTGGQCWAEYQRLYRSPWISRTWILQEIALSQKATLGIGRYVMDWDILEGSFHFVQEQGLIEGMMWAGEEIMLGLLNFIRLQEIRQISRSSNETSLLNVLRATRSFKVTNPKDKILAVLGILQSLPTQLEDVSDYTLSTAEVYHRTALYLLETSFLPEVWAHAGLQRRISQPDMPSWVPDWYADTPELNERPLNLFRPTPFLAGGRPQNTCVLQAEDAKYPRALMSLGLCHDNIIRKSNAFVRPESEGKTNSQACLAWIRSAQACLQDGNNLVYDDVEEAFARTLLVDDLYSGGNATRSSTAIADVKTTFRATLVHLENPNRKDLDLKGTSEAQVRTCSLQMMSTMRARRFAVTDTGYMCLVPSCTEVGDRVAIFFGFPIPFTIRLEPGSEGEGVALRSVRAQLVGDTYMHGVMYAEAFPEAVRTGREPYEIVVV